MTGFLLMGFFMTITVGAVVAFCITGIIFEDGWRWTRVVLFLVIALAIGFGIACIYNSIEQAEMNAWNNGYCSNCNTKWRFTNAEYIKRHGERFYYVCDNCGAIIHRGA